MFTQRKHLILTAVVTLASGLISQARADEGLASAREKVETKDKTILFFMHPTCTLDSTKYLGQSAGQNSIGYTFYCTGAAGGKWESTLYFSYDAQGSITRIDNGYTSTWTGQFTAANLVISVVKDWIKNNESLKKNALLMAAVDRADARGILVVLLK